MYVTNQMYMNIINTVFTCDASVDIVEGEAFSTM